MSIFPNAYIQRQHPKNNAEFILRNPAQQAELGRPGDKTFYASYKNYKVHK